MVIVTFFTDEKIEKHVLILWLVHYIPAHECEHLSYYSVRVCHRCGVQDHLFVWSTLESEKAAHKQHLFSGMAGLNMRFQSSCNTQFLWCLSSSECLYVSCLTVWSGASVPLLFSILSQSFQTTVSSVRKETDRQADRRTVFIRYISCFSLQHTSLSRIFPISWDLTDIIYELMGWFSCR